MKYKTKNTKYKYFAGVLVGRPSFSWCPPQSDFSYCSRSFSSKISMASQCKINGKSVKINGKSVQNQSQVSAESMESQFKINGNIKYQCGKAECVAIASALVQHQNQQPGVC